ncbi:MAG: TetR family transcriptional regulator [Candidatus Heimdallarchaeota archaeon]|nr:TetR family transcriptional regulator [Candidatus Heimdallarchaeota archaeon]
MPVKESIRLSKEKRKESIIETTMNLLTKIDFESLTMRTIAKEEGISESMLYRFFTNKYYILYDIIQAQTAKLIESWREFLEAIKAMIPDLEISLPIIGKIMARKIGENQEFFRFLTREGRKIPKIMDEMAEEVGVQKKEPYFRQAIISLNFHEIITDYFRRCQEAGNLRKDLQPEDCTIIIISTFMPLIGSFPLFIFRDKPEDYNMTELIDSQIKVLLHGMVSGD